MKLLRTSILLALISSVALAHDSAPAWMRHLENQAGTHCCDEHDCEPAVLQKHERRHRRRQGRAYDVKSYMLVFEATPDSGPWVCWNWIEFEEHVLPAPWGVRCLILPMGA